MKYSAVVDANVLVSALLSSRSGKDSNPLKVIREEIKDIMKGAE